MTPMGKKKAYNIVVTGQNKVQPFCGNMPTPWWDIGKEEQIVKQRPEKSEVSSKKVRHHKIVRQGIGWGVKNMPHLDKLRLIWTTSMYLALNIAFCLVSLFPPHKILWATAQAFLGCLCIWGSQQNIDNKTESNGCGRRRHTSPCFRKDDVM